MPDSSIARPKIPLSLDWYRDVLSAQPFCIEAMDALASAHVPASHILYA